MDTLKSLNLKINILIATAIVGIIVLVWFKPNSNNNNSYYKDSTYVTHDTTVYNTHYSETKPQIIINKDTLILDTAMIRQLINDYFAERYYNDTLLNDTSATIILAQKVTTNRILSKDLTFKNNKPTTITNVQITNDYHSSFLLSGNILYNTDRIEYGIGAGYKYRNHSGSLNVYTDKTIGLNYNYYLHKHK